MAKKLSIITASIVAFAFVFIAIAHACSGVASMTPAVQQNPMHMGESDSFPCGKEKSDICKSVRDSMLSVKPAVSGIDSPEKTFSPPPILLVSPILPGSLPLVLVSKVSFHPVFKLPLSLSYLVLRI